MTGARIKWPKLSRPLGVAVETAIEVIGLALWLGLINGTIPSSYLGSYLEAIIILFVLLLGEHIISQVQFTEQYLSSHEFGRLVLFTSFEVLVWGVWLFLIPINGIVAILVFILGLYAEHQITYNVKNERRLGRGFLDFSNPRNIIGGLIVFTLFETLFAAAWVATAQLLFMIVGSFIEHYIAGIVASKP